MNRLEKHCYAHSFIHFLLLDNCRWQIHLSTLHYCLHHLSTLYGLTSQLQVLAAKLALLRYGHRCHIGGCVSSPGRLYQAFAACAILATSTCLSDAVEIRAASIIPNISSHLGRLS